LQDLVKNTEFELNPFQKDPYYHQMNGLSKEALNTKTATELFSGKMLFFKANWRPFLDVMTSAWTHTWARVYNKKLNMYFIQF